MPEAGEAVLKPSKHRRVYVVAATAAVAAHIASMGGGYPTLAKARRALMEIIRATPAAEPRQVYTVKLPT